jgi:UDP-2,3-diacylglucosamine pyrophosphatase LpxH
MDMNGVVNGLRRLLGFGKWSLSAYIKHKVKKAVEFISRFEEAVVREAHARGCQGVICGHIHTPDDRMIDGIHYLNDGDWVESCTALVEHFDGRFEIIDWKKNKPEIVRQLVEVNATPEPESPALVHLR